MPKECVRTYIIIFECASVQVCRCVCVCCMRAVTQSVSMPTIMLLSATDKFIIKAKGGKIIPGGKVAFPPKCSSTF